MDVNNFLQSEATQFVGTAAANTIGLVIGTIHHYIMLISSTKRNAGFPFPLCHSGMLRSDAAFTFT